MGIKIIQFLAVVISALALVPAGAHLAALPNKIAMPQADYFTVQSIYYGWAILGLLWIAALVIDILLAIVVRSQIVNPSICKVVSPSKVMPGTTKSRGVMSGASACETALAP